MEDRATAERIRNAAEVVRQINTTLRSRFGTRVHDDEKIKITDLLISAHENPDEFDAKMTQARNRFRTLQMD